MSALGQDPLIEHPGALRARVLPRDGAGALLLVLLHGYGEPTAALTDRVALLDPDRTCTVVVPDAPFEHRGSAIWHRALSTSREMAAMQYATSLRLLDDLLGRAESITGLPAAEAIVGGFSQGGGLGFGLLIAAEVQHRPAAAFGICSFPPAFEGFRIDRAAAAERPCCLISAQRDRFAPIEVSRHGAAALSSTGLTMAYSELDIEHEMTDQAAAIAGRWISAIARGDLPSAASNGPAESGGAHRPTEADAFGEDTGFYEGLWSEVS